MRCRRDPALWGAAAATFLAICLASALCVAADQPRLPPLRAAEIVKRRVAGLHQVSEISSVNITDLWEPKEEGLSRLEITRQVRGGVGADEVVAGASYGEESCRLVAGG